MQVVFQSLNAFDLCTFCVKDAIGIVGTLICPFIVLNLSITFNFCAKLGFKIICFQGVSQKFPFWAVRHKLGISELWSKGVWGPALKGPYGV